MLLTRGSLLPAATAVALLVLTGTGCKKDEEGAKITGEVQTAEGAPLSGVLVSAYGVTARSDGKGRFSLPGVKLRGVERIVVNFQKDGYFDKTVGSRATGGNPFVRTVMASREKLGEVDAEAGGTVEGDGLTLEVPGGAFVGPDGQPLSGTVSIYGAVFDPDDESFSRSMPGGDFTASDESGADGVLTSFGALAVEAESEDGEAAELTLQAAGCLSIPSSMRASAPDTVPLWQLDLFSGTWNESGIAERNGSQYCFYLENMGRVNCDLFGRTALVTGRVCSAGEPVPEAAVEVHQYETAADDEGVYGALVPADTSFELRSEHGGAAVDGIQAGETLEVDLGDCGGEALGASEGYLRIVEEYASDCYLHFDVSGSQISPSCPECEWDFDWAFDVRYRWSESATTVSGCPETPSSGELSSAVSYWEPYLSEYMDVWAFAPSTPYGPMVMFLYSYYGDGWYPGYYFPATQSGSTVSFSYYYFEGAFSPAGGRGSSGSDPGSPSSLPSSGVGR
jgi:hypothetical protein